MNSEDDFQFMLDDHPESWQTRLVFADWLQDHGDPRADGYRALGQQRVCPIRIQMQSYDRDKPGEWLFIYGNLANNSEVARERWGGCFLDRVWFRRLGPRHEHDRNTWWRYYPTRRAAEDTAAIAFARLGKARRTGLLATIRAQLPSADDSPKSRSRRKA